MPSFLTEENSPVHSQNSAILHLDPSSRYDVSHEKANGSIAQPAQPQPPNDCFEESSAHSTHTSVASDVRAQLNGDSQSTQATEMSVLNGQLVDGAPRVKSPEDLGEVSLHNGMDRSLSSQPPTTNGTAANESPASSPRDTKIRTSMSSGAGGSIQQSPIEMYMTPASKGDISVVDNGPPSLTTIPSNVPLATFPSSSQSSIPYTNPSSDPNAAKVPPHRFSSPPLYNSTAATPSSSGTLHPPAGALKHRHTLEVPKLAPGRGSRDGLDSALTTGRFSPTAATTPAPGIGVRRASLSLARRNTRSLHSEVPRDEIVPDEDALRWAEAYRQKRASKRKKKEFEDDDRVLVGTKVDEKHANWVTAYNMLTGIRVSVSRTNAKLDRPLTDADFEAKQKSTFDIAGNELVPSAKYDFKFKDYAPWVFRHLRALFRLDPADYLMSLTGKYILSELGSPGKSGSFFYFSRDYKYIIKTIHHAEHKFLRKVLKDYYDHVTENPNTLLSQFYGLHRVKMPYGKKIHFVVMNNLFPPHRDIHQTFDLKGSTIGRDYREENLEKNPRATMKDLNWLRRKQHIELGLEKKRLFLEQLNKDVRLMQKLHIMDYSLLIGIHDLSRGNEENLRDKTLKVFNPGGDGPEEYYPPAHQQSVLMRTPSKLENARKARELRQMIKAERPIPMGETASRMPNELEEGHNRPGFVFNQDDGGFRATHEDNRPADEIYYLGVIDCLTHYGMIKKIEHFWKGLSHDRTQISPVPPHQYGERFMHFIEGITMSPEEARREAAERDAALAAAAAEEERDRIASFGSVRRKSTNAIPPMPTYAAPPPPSPLPSGQMSPEADDTIRRAEHQAEKSERKGTHEEDVPERTLKTSSTSPVSAGSSMGPPYLGQGANGTSHGGQQPILPIVEEAGEGASTGGRSASRTSQLSVPSESSRPLTPAKDGAEDGAGFGNPIIGSSRSGSFNRDRTPPTPPKTAGSYINYKKPESADSGYGVSGAAKDLKSTSGSQKSHRIQPQISRDSLDKALPPLPRT